MGSLLQRKYLLVLSFDLQIKKKVATRTPKNLICGGAKLAVNIRMPDEMKAALDKVAAIKFRSFNS
jgi:hypothetical protein